MVFHSQYRNAGFGHSTETQLWTEKANSKED